MEKICYTCKQPGRKFNKNKSKRDGLSSICVECSRERSRLYYKDNTFEHRKVTMSRRRKLRDEAQKAILEFFKMHPCVDCGEADPIVLEMDHQFDKKHGVSYMMSGGYSWVSIRKEMDKCQVRCCNCHRRKTAFEIGSYRTKAT